MSDRGSSFGDFLTGLLVGGAIGYAIALLNAPRPGDETRQMLTEKSRELREKAMDTVQTTVDKTGKLVEESRGRVQERVSEYKNRGDSVITDVREQVSDTLRRAADEVDPDQPPSPGTTGPTI